MSHHPDDPAPAGLLKTGAEIEAEIARLAQRLDGVGAMPLPRVEVDDAGYHVVVPAGANETLRDKIGRASCRERVFRTV